MEDDKDLSLVGTFHLVLEQNYQVLATRTRAQLYNVMHVQHIKLMSVQGHVHVVLQLLVCGPTVYVCLCVYVYIRAGKSAFSRLACYVDHEVYMRCHIMCIVASCVLLSRAVTVNNNIIIMFPEMKTVYYIR